MCRGFLIRSSVAKSEAFFFVQALNTVAQHCHLHAQRVQGQPGTHNELSRSHSAYTATTRCAVHDVGLLWLELFNLPQSFYHSKYVTLILDWFNS